MTHDHTPYYFSVEAKVRGYHQRMGLCIAMKRKIIGNQCLLYAQDLAITVVLSTMCMTMCYAQYAPTAHATVGLDKGPLWQYLYRSEVVLEQHS